MQRLLCASWHWKCSVSVRYRLPGKIARSTSVPVVHIEAQPGPPVGDGISKFVMFAALKRRFAGHFGQGGRGSRPGAGEEGLRVFINDGLGCQEERQKEQE